MQTIKVQCRSAIEPLLNRITERLRLGRTPAVRTELLIRSATELTHSGVLELMLELLNDTPFAPAAAFVLECDGSLGRPRTRYLPYLAAVYEVPHIVSYDELRAKWFLKHGINFDELVLP